MEVGIIGGGAAGFFAAISVKQHHPSTNVSIFEKSQKLLSKVKISGGGRCNVTNGETEISILSKAYPRGQKKLKNAFHSFSTKDTMEWFEKRGVPLVIQEDNCVFPKSQDSQSIIDCFLAEAKSKEISIFKGHGIVSIVPENEKVVLHFKDGSSSTFDKVIVATGGSPSRKGLNWLDNLDIEIVNPVPSLFTFNMPQENVRELMGIVVKEVKTSIQGTKLKSDGPLLVTHWGMSGPAILKLSAFGARLLEEMNYTFNVQINWTNDSNHQSIYDELQKIIAEQKNKNLDNYRPFLLPERLWHFLVKRSGLEGDKKWGDLGKKSINRMVNVLANDIYKESGKTTFKEEFVTAGGGSLASIDFKTMAARNHKNVYFAGELLDIDGITGGYNFQAAWTTAYIAGMLK